MKYNFKSSSFSRHILTLYNGAAPTHAAAHGELCLLFLYSPLAFLTPTLSFLMRRLFPSQHLVRKKHGPLWGQQPRVLPREGVSCKMHPPSSLFARLALAAAPAGSTGPSPALPPWASPSPQLRLSQQGLNLCQHGKGGMSSE